MGKSDFSIDLQCLGNTEWMRLADDHDFDNETPQDYGRMKNIMQANGLHTSMQNQSKRVWGETTASQEALRKTSRRQKIDIYVEVRSLPCDTCRVDCPSSTTRE